VGSEPHGRKREKTMTKRVYRWGLLLFLTGGVAAAQKPLAKWFGESWEDFSQSHTIDGQAQRFAQELKQQRLEENGLIAGPRLARQGRWWSNPRMAAMLGLTADQVKKMDDIFQQHRLKLIDLNASLEKEEAILEPLVGADQPDDGKVLPQLDRVAQARAELEKANSRMLWSVRRVLTPDQWKKLQTEPSALRPGLQKWVQK
jgi:Spy/CpxP family protein refolding chaperone